MSRLLLFNPENDSALAADTVRYTPPAIAIELHRSGVLLPFWWAESTDCVAIPDNLAEPAMRLKAHFNLHGSILTNSTIHNVDKVMPWGWSKHTRQQLIDYGINKTILPPDSTIDKLRALSHRRTTCIIHKILSTPAELHPIEAASASDAADAINGLKGKAIVKLPWSNSGRGIFYVSRLNRDKLLKDISGMISRQGSVMIEPELDKIADFAMLFYCSDKKVEFKGISVFKADSKGCYCGNIIASQNYLHSLLMADPTPWREKLTNALTQIIIDTDYCGWIGVDMMIYRSHSDGTIQINPCIEVNMRMTMGVLSLFIAEKMFMHDSVGTLRISTNPVSPNEIDLSPAKGKFKMVLSFNRQT